MQDRRRPLPVQPTAGSAPAARGPDRWAVQVRHDERLVVVEPDLLARPPSSWSRSSGFQQIIRLPSLVDNGLAGSNALPRMPTGRRGLPVVKQSSTAALL